MRRFLSRGILGAFSKDVIKLSRFSSSGSRNLAEEFLQEGELDPSCLTKITFSADAAKILQFGAPNLSDDIIGYFSEIIDNSKDAADVLHSRFLKPAHRDMLMENLAHNQDVVRAVSGGFVPVDSALKLVEGRFFNNTQFGRTLARNVVELSSSDIADILAFGKISDLNLQSELIKRIDNETDLVRVLIRGEIKKSLAVPLLDKLSFDNVILLINEIENASFASQLKQLATSRLEQALANYEEDAFKKEFTGFINNQSKNHVPVFELNLLRDNLDKDGLAFRVGELTGTNPNFDSITFQEFCDKFLDYIGFEKIAKLCNALNLSQDDLAELSKTYNLGNKLISYVQELSDEVKSIRIIVPEPLDGGSRNSGGFSR